MTRVNDIAIMELERDVFEERSSDDAVNIINIPKQGQNITGEN